MGAYNIDININTGNVTTSINGVVSSMKDLNDIVDKMNEAMGKGSGSTAKATKSIVDYAGSYKTLKTDIEATRKALLAEIKALDDVRKDTVATTEDNKKAAQAVRDLEKTYRSQTAAMRQYSSLLDKEVVPANNKAKSSFLSLNNGLSQVAGAFGLSAGLYGAVAALKMIVSTIAEFDLAQKKLQSVLGESNSGMQDIKQSAIFLGQASIFGAKGVTELQIELAKMGFAKKDIIDMQGAIVDLATATQEDLAGSAEVVANIIRSFQLSAEDATAIVDIMGKAFNDSALDLANFREAIKYVAPIAAQANFKFEETVSLLEQLSNAGIKGSLAGTSLTNIISRLGNENSKFVKTLGHTVNGFDEFIASLIELKKRGADLNDTFELVDRRAAATFTILLEGVDSVEQFKQKLEDSAGVMKEQTAVQLDSVTNKMLLLKNSFNAMILSLDSGDGVLSNWLKDSSSWLSTIINQLTNAKELAINTEWKKTASDMKQLGIKPNDMFKDIGFEMEKAGQKQSEAFWAGFISFNWASKLAADAEIAYEEQRRKIKETNKATTKTILDDAKGQIEIWRKQFGSSFLDKAVPDIILQKLNEQLKDLDPSTVKAKKLAKTIELLSKEYSDYVKGIELTKAGADATQKEINEAKRVAKDLLGIEVDNLNQRKRIAESKIKLSADTIELEKQLYEKEQIFKTDAGSRDVQLAEDISDLKIQILNTQTKESADIVNSNFEYDKKIAERKHKFEQQWGDNKASEQKSFDLEMEAIGLVHQIKLNEIAGKGNAELLKRLQELLEAKKKISKDANKQEEADALSDIDYNKKVTEFRINELLRGVEKENALIDNNYKYQLETLDAKYKADQVAAKDDVDELLRIQDQYQKDSELLRVGRDAAKRLVRPKDKNAAELLFPNATEGQQEAMQKSFELAKDGITQLADAWVAATDKIVEARNRQVDEAQSALETEIALAEAGFASNVTLKRKDLATSKSLRAEALAEQKKAQKASAAIDLAATLSSLVVASANLFKDGIAKLGIFGVPVAAGMIVAMLAAFAGYRSKIKAINSVDKYETGGWVGGLRHTQGGTNIEAEKGEFVINRKSAAKHSSMIEAINNDDTITMNKMYINGLKNGVLKTSVSLDDSDDLKAIRKALERGGGDVYIQGNYRIERKGNTITKVRLN